MRACVRLSREIFEQKAFDEFRGEELKPGMYFVYLSLFRFLDILFIIFYGVGEKWRALTFNDLYTICLKKIKAIISMQTKKKRNKKQNRKKNTHTHTKWKSTKFGGLSNNI